MPNDMWTYKQLHYLTHTEAFPSGKAFFMAISYLHAVSCFLHKKIPLSFHSIARQDNIWLKVKEIARRNENIKRYILRGLAIIFLGLTAACEDPNVVVLDQKQEAAAARPAQAVEVKKYVIRKGEHHATLTYETAELSRLKFKALFDSSSVYKTLDPANQGDINKLYGVSDCNSYHHNNSVRFGWRWYDNQLEIWAYSYVNGERFSSFIDTVQLDTYNTYEILFSENKYVIRLNDKEVEINRACQAKSAGYKLFPYFGGNESAPKDISIWIQELNDW